MVQATTWGVPRSGPATPAVMAERMDDSLDALLSSQASATAPSYAVEGTLWADNSVSGTISVKMYDGADWITVATIDKSGNTSAPAGETTTGAALRVATDEAAARTAIGFADGLNATGSAPLYACRAWANFNGTGTVAIRGSGNVSSITDNGTGDYTVNFTTALPNANYSLMGSTTPTASSTPRSVGVHGGLQTTSACRIVSGVPAVSYNDCEFIHVGFIG
jgi:hypothetical protein